MQYRCIFMKDRMKSDLLPGPSAGASRSRRALAQPRFLVATMACAMAGFAYLATAQSGRSAVPMKAASGAASRKVASLADLPALIEAYGASRQKSASVVGTPTSGRALAAIGTGQSGYNLVESDLTPSTKSDEREPVYAPGGQTIAFVSNGVDANKDGRIDDALNNEGKYHVWVMNADGTNQRQISGLNAEDINRNQRHPSWQPTTGQQLVYSDGEGDNAELYVVRPFEEGILPTSSVELPQRRTFFTGTKVSPTWSPNGASIVFASNAKLGSDANGVAGQYDLYSISPDGSDGSADSITRLTGGTADPAGNNADDLNPAYSAVNANVLYFSSNRTFTNGVVEKLDVGRRIWYSNVGNGAVSQLTDPLGRANGKKDDQDDYPSASLTNGNAERVSFQSNSLIDSSDTTQDLNIWALPFSTAGFNNYVEAAPRVFASDYSGNQVFNYNPLNNTAGTNYQTLTGVNAPEGIVVRDQNVYVANSGTGRIIGYDQETGNQLPNFTTPTDSAPKASGMISDFNYLYVGSGIGATDKVAIYRFDFGGGLQGNAPNSAAFSSGEPDAAKVTNGTEGLTFSAGNNQAYIFASLYNDDKINVYRKSDGAFVTTFTTGNATNPALNPLDGPTGLTFGPDLNGDGFQDLYVNSSNTDDVLAYAGPRPNDATFTANVGPGSDVPPGTFISTVVADNQGQVSNLNAPEGIQFIQHTDDPTIYDLFVSSFQNRNVSGAVGTGDHINRYRIVTTTINPANPATQVATPAGRNGLSGATYIQFNGARGIGYFDFNTLARTSLATTTGIPQPTPTPTPDTTAVESNGDASVLTNILSSPSNYAASGLNITGDVIGEDKAADREPAFSRSTASTALSSRLTFASTRLYAPMPSSNARDANGNKPSPSNPYGRNDGTNGGTHDIWGSAAQDTTPPALIPQAAGNQLYPVVAPGPQSPFPAPREYTAGLRPNADLKVAVVVSDFESGLATGVNGVVTVSLRQAGQERFTSSTERVNENIPVSIRREGRPDVVSGSSFNLLAYDDGPFASGGHERQADAVAGDGTYYCEGTGKTPSTAGDFFIDISVSDQRGNSFTYDNIWGINTLQFPGTAGKDLLVSDYTAGQTFPALLGDSRFVSMLPVESYYLTNAGGQAFDPTTNALIGSSTPATFANVDVWRTQCRGPVPQATLDNYGPNLDNKQIDPRETEPGAAGPFTEKTRAVPVSNSAIIWAAPYAGTAFVGPGTITDALTQSRLTVFMENGGRLFVTGRDVAFALSNNGRADNDFLSSELGATFSGELLTDTVDAASTDTSRSFVSYGNQYDAKYYDLQIPYHFSNPVTDTYGDAALTQNQYGGTSMGNVRSGAAGLRMDTITPNPGSGTTLTTAYTVGGEVVGQRIEKVRTNKRSSRAVFFSFGFEAVNRRYRVATPGFPLVALNMRRNVATNVLRYFKTGTVSGKVVNDKTNEPVPNLLLVITGPGGPYLVRTDANGDYEVKGLPQGSYTIDIAFIIGNRLSTAGTPGATTDPPGFFDATAVNFGIAGGDRIVGVNLRPIPDTPGSLNGKVVTSKKTPNDFNDDLILDAKAVGMAVLVRSIDNVGTVTGGGRFAQLVRTNAGGAFAFSGVPANVQLQVIFNPTVEDIPAESGLRATYQNAGGPNKDIGRRIIPDARRITPISVPVGNTFTLNDPDPAKYPDPTKGPALGVDADVAADSGVPIVVPEGPSVRGTVSINGVPASGAIVELLDANGKSLSPRNLKTTLEDGTYVFSDIVPGNYQVRATATTTDKITASKTVSITVVQGSDAIVDINILFYSISGKVTVNGQPAVGATVQLLTAANQPFTPTRQTTTNSTGVYTLTNIPNGSYRVKATQGKTSGSVAVDVADANRTNIDIVLTNQQLSGIVNLSIDGATAQPLKGATVELLTTDGKSLNPRVTTTTAADGSYSFDEAKPGSYKVRASYMGDSANTSTITVTSGTPTTVRAIALALQNLTVKVTDANNKVVASAVLQLVLNNATVATGVTDQSGSYTFKLIPAGKYTVLVTRANLGGQGAVNVQRGVKPRVLVIKLQGDSTGSNNPTAFNVKGKIYLISLPYQILNNPKQSNVSEQTGKLPAATIKVGEAFTVKPVDANTGVRNYFLQRFDYLTGQYVDLDASSNLVRGVGYLLQVVNAGTSIKMPGTAADTRALTPLIDPNFEKTFTVTLRSDPSSPAGGNNGRNLIGFGFNPAKYGKADFAKATFVHPDGRTARNFAEAVKNGWISNQITTIDSRGSTPLKVNATQIKSYGGYFVQTFVNGLKLTFINPVK
jgi:hypothetical protein